MQPEATSVQKPINIPVVIALALAGVLYLGQIFHVRWGGFLAKDVYAVTSDISDGGKYKYWKNGVETQAFNIDGFVCGSDFHIRGDIYQAGSEKHSDGNGIAIIKKNGYALCYLTDGKFDADATRVFVSGDDVYASGCEVNLNPQKQVIATVWRNGDVLYRLTNGSLHTYSLSLFITGGDVYAAGFELNPQGKSVATVWKNGKELYRLTNGNFNAGVWSLYVTSGDVYAAGFEDNPQGKRVATVWKNGKVLYRLTNGSFSANVLSLFVSDGDAYAAGYERNPQENMVATVWKNGAVLYRLGDERVDLVFVR
jgi:hypothetical protein